VFEMGSLANPNDGRVQENCAENGGEQKQQEIRRVADERRYTQQRQGDKDTPGENSVGL